MVTLHIQQWTAPEMGFDTPPDMYSVHRSMVNVSFYNHQRYMTGPYGTKGNPIKIEVEEDHPLAKLLTKDAVEVTEDHPLFSTVVECCEQAQKKAQESLLDEPVLDDDFPVHYGYNYVIDGTVRKADITGTVRGLKFATGGSVVRRCDMSGRGL